MAEQALEQVLVIPRATVPGGCSFRGIRRASEGDLDRLRLALRRHGRFVARTAAERDAAYKQPIPYVVLRDGAAIFLMERTEAGGDPRLHRKASIGVGGHVNPVDAGDDPLASALRREWAEELHVAWEPDFGLVGVLNDDTDAVGAVHLGIVFVVNAAGRPVAVREHAKLSGRFVATEELRAAWDRLESWSRLVAASLLG
ncbi:MAG: NUDIX domain-containing protein [Chloroflexota bacterium]|nr:NUDIX domain-containing protein [Chloroflexota bacterium]